MGITSVPWGMENGQAVSLYTLRSSHEMTVNITNYGGVVQSIWVPSDRGPMNVALGFPTLLGTSRKSTLGKLTGRSVDEREFGTAGTVALAANAGIDIVRVHDVREQADVVRVSDAIARGWRPAGWNAVG